MKQFRKTNYYVEIDGTVLSKKRKNVCKLRTYLTKDGYYYYSFYLTPCRKTTFLVHRLVTECYLSSFTYGLQVNHIDGNKSNNHVSNLEMVSCKENISKYQQVYKEYFVTKNWNNESKLCRTYKEAMEFCGYSSRSSVQYIINHPVSKKYTIDVICNYYNSDTTIDKK
jgi:hypothetical protein